MRCSGSVCVLSLSLKYMKTCSGPHSCQSNHYMIFWWSWKLNKFAVFRKISSVFNLRNQLTFHYSPYGFSTLNQNWLGCLAKAQAIVWTAWLGPSKAAWFIINEWGLRPIVSEDSGGSSVSLFSLLAERLLTLPVSHNPLKWEPMSGGIIFICTRNHPSPCIIDRKSDLMKTNRIRRTGQ